MQLPQTGPQTPHTDTGIRGTSEGEAPLPLLVSSGALHPTPCPGLPSALPQGPGVGDWRGAMPVPCLTSTPPTMTCSPYCCCCCAQGSPKSLVPAALVLLASVCYVFFSLSPPNTSPQLCLGSDSPHRTLGGNERLESRVESQNQAWRRSRGKISSKNQIAGTMTLQH